MECWKYFVKHFSLNKLEESLKKFQVKLLLNIFVSDKIMNIFCQLYQ